MKTKKPSAIVYGWNFKGDHILYSDVYFEEELEEFLGIVSISDQSFQYSHPLTKRVIGFSEPMKV